ncbi:hypothetical protein GGI20_005262 [Coemansia sp. BCRC 34301]|nr:hypothetical protein GGI20_005262 [Coemansia sp. BCRC 34301]
MVIIIAVLYFIQLLAVLYSLWNRKYPPIKAKGPWIMSAIFVATIFWFVGDIQVNGHAPLKGSPLVNCKFFGVWMHVLVGICPVGSLIALRAYGLYQVFCLNRPYLGKPLYLSAGMLVGILLAFGIVTQALAPAVSVYYIEGLDICSYHLGCQVSIFVMVWVLWIFVVLLNWRIRNIKSSFKESRESMIMCIISIGGLTYMTVISYAVPDFPINVKLRVLTTAINQFAAITTWWIPMAVPILNCLFRREKYLKLWVYKLRQDGLHRAYHVDPKSSEERGEPSPLNHSYLRQQSTYVNEIAKGNEFFYGDSEKAATHTIAESNESAVSLVQRHAKSPPVSRRPPWDKAVNGAAVQPYTPIINFPEPATNTPPPHTAGPRLHQETKYSIDGRQLL